MVTLNEILTYLYYQVEHGDIERDTNIIYHQAGHGDIERDTNIPILSRWSLYIE